MYKTIILPIDLSQSERNPAALAVAKKLVDKGGRIILVNVVEDIPTYVAAELPAGFVENSMEDARKDLAAVAKKARPKAEIDVRHGSPHNAILAAAEEKGADLIIIASHRPGLSDYFLGSTAARVVRHANCSVLVTR
jgi:universal stress protein F